MTLRRGGVGRQKVSVSLRDDPIRQVTDPRKAAVSAGISYRLDSGLELFSAVDAQSRSDDHRENVMSGVWLRF
ncbi:hypothetical protein [Sphingobium sp.]|uniref:hypothetical protein n=1 Tax=Sphingobium sp. TaxID=1912891 RepID=UPI003BB74488